MAARARKQIHQRFGVIGFGAIGDEIVRCLDSRAEAEALVGFLDLPERVPELKRKSAGRFPVVSELDGLLALGPDLVVEAAGHAAVKRFGAELLARGYDLLIASVGALADNDISTSTTPVSARSIR